MAFEIFKDTGARTREFISITETKTFGVPRAFLDKHRITSDYKVIVLFDKETNQIALHFIDSDTKIGFAVRPTGERQGAIIAARSFFDIKGIDVKRYAGRYDFETKTLKDLGINKEGEAYVITLIDKTTKATTNMPSEVETQSEINSNISEGIDLSDLFGEGERM